MKITLQNLSQLSIILLGLALLYIILQQFQSFLRPFSVALLLSFLTIGFFRMGWQQKIVRLGYVVAIIGVVVALFYGASYMNLIGVDDKESLSQSLLVQDSSITAEYDFEGIFNESDLSNYVSFEKLNELLQSLLQIALKSLSALFSEIFLVILFLFFIIPSYDPTLRYLKKRYFKENIKEFDKAMVEIEHGIKSYLGVKFWMSIGTALLSGFIMILFGVENVLVLVVLTFALNFIPNVGSFVAVVIILGVFGIQDGFTTPLVFLALLLISVQTLFGNIIEPKVAGKGLGMSPLLILFALLFWGSLWGVGGMLISVPLTHAIKTVIEALSTISK